MTHPIDEAAVFAAAGDQDVAALLEPYRRELGVHCYRMLASFQDSEDMVQETFLRAWRNRHSFEGRSSLRAWLYRIATNACLDLLERRPRQPTASGEVPWLQPYPDRLLDEVSPGADEPETAALARETIELAFITAVQHLPPLQRAVVILRDVLGWPAKETAALLETTVAATNSALQRARSTLRSHLGSPRSEWTASGELGEEEMELVRAYVDATERLDIDGLVAILHEDLRFAMPPEPGTWIGRESVVRAWVDGGFGSPGFDDFRCITTRANRQPAVANYLRRPGDSLYRPLALDVLRIENGEISEVISFPDTAFPAFGLPHHLEGGPTQPGHG